MPCVTCPQKYLIRGYKMQQTASRYDQNYANRNNLQSINGSKTHCIMECRVAVLLAKTRMSNRFFQKRLIFNRNKHDAELQRKPPPANQSNILYTRVVISHGITILGYTITLNQYV